MRLPASIVMHGQHFGISSEAAPGSTAFVLLTLAVLGFLFAGFACGAWVLYRREKRPTPHQQLLMELENEDHAGQLAAGEHGTIAQELKPWEREADWWQK